jgi:hypothetical protein
MCRVVFDVPVHLCIWHVLRSWQTKLWQIVGNQDKELFQTIFTAMNSVMKTAEKDKAVVKNTLRAQLNAWSSSTNAKMKTAPKYFEYWEKKVGASLSILSVCGLDIVNMPTKMQSLHDCNHQSPVMLCASTSESGLTCRLEQGASNGFDACV